jgi:DNA-binding NarL/FixJ family response regulator
VIRVLLVDDHPVVRSGLAGLLDAESDIEVVGEAGNGLEAVALAERVHPDVVLMDLHMPMLDGPGATAVLARSVPATRVLVLTTFDTDTDIIRAVEAGATGYLLKDTPRDQLVDAVRRAATGETVLAPPVAARLMQRIRDRDFELTAREMQVLQGVSRGLSNAGIGRELFVSEATIKTHLLHIFEKLGVGDRTAAVTVALERGILTTRRLG